MRLQFMSISALVLVALMVTELFIFVLIVIGYDNLFQYSSLSLSSGNYGQLLSQSANSFARSALSSSLNALFAYEYNASARHGNLISNLSNSVGSLVSSGTLQGVAANTPAANMLLSYMANSTFAAYNASIANFTGFSSKNVVITESVPVVRQYNPYSISINYVETVMINASGDVFDYSLPVNASVSLNGTPDLFYAEQGINRRISFANVSSSTTLVGSQQAAAGNSIGYVYGTVVYAPGSPYSCSALKVPPGLNSPPFNSLVIIATPDASHLSTSCLYQYGGLITQSLSPTNIPKKMPFLVYNQSYQSSNIMNYLQTGSKVLLYGPGLSTLYIEPLRSSVYSGAYFSSPFAPSYINRLQENLTPSGAGVFSFYDYNRLVSAFSGNSYIELPSNDFGFPASGSSTTAYSASVSVWFRTSSDGVILGVQNTAPPASPTQWTPAIYVDTGGRVRASMFGHGSVNDQLVSSNSFNDNTWHDLVDTYSNGIESLYVDGQLIATNTVPEVPQSSSFTSLGTGYTQGWANSNGGWFYFNGQLANFQVYNSLLSPSQVYSLYQQGLGGLPQPGNYLNAWYTLNGNANDLSGNSYNGFQATNVVYSPLVNYRADSVFGPGYTGPVFPVPGVLNCDTSSQCRNPALQHVYLGTAPLETGTNAGQALLFNTTYPGWLNISDRQATALTTGISGSNLTFSSWIYLNQVPTNYAGIVTTNSPTGSGGFFGGSGEGTLAYFFPGSCNLEVLVSVSGGIFGAATYQGTSSTCFKTGRWYNVISYVNQSSGKYGLYINGVQDSAFPSVYFGPLFAYNGFDIGNFTFSTPSYFPGYITDVQIYNTSISSRQANALYGEGPAGAPLHGLGLIGWWPLNGNTRDYSGNGHNATLNGLSGFASLYGGNLTTPGSTPYQTQDEWQAFGLSDP